jgi:mono/diheme cytochrome c family protein
MLMRAIWCGILLTASAAIGTVGLAHAQDEMLGKAEYLRSCASCHGVSGKGDGPVAKSLVKPPADLTKLSEKNNGVFPISRVYNVIDGRLQTLVHGTREMPVWGDIYMQGLADRTSRDFTSKEMAEALVRARILMLVEYISTLQDKKRGGR